MFELLFSSRIAVGKKLESILESQGKSKSDICKEAGISRPTFNKILAGDINNEQKYESYLKKIAKVISINLKDLLDPATLRRAANIGMFRQRFGYDYKAISDKLGYPIDIIKKWESGEIYPTKGQLIELAVLFRTTISNLEGYDFFSYQTSALNDFLRKGIRSEYNQLSGFWGHIGIQVPHKKHILWYPVTASTMKSLFHRIQGDEYIVFPCTNNKLVLINMNNIERVIFLDEACDAYSDWSVGPNDMGTIPIEYYRIFELLSWDGEDEDIPQDLIEKVRTICSDYGWDSDYLEAITVHVRIIFESGKTDSFAIDGITQLSDYMEYVYNGEEPMDSIIVEELSGAEVIIQPKRISVLEAPLLKVEDALRQNLEDDESFSLF